MEWVETTGPTIEAALDAALDELGVDEDEVEFEVLQEPKSGLFGRIGGNPARIRARVKPISREKPGERNRASGRNGRRNQGRSGGRGGGSSRSNSPASETDATKAAPAAAPAAVAVADDEDASTPSTAPRKRRRRGGRGRSGGAKSTPQATQNAEKGNDVTTEEIPIGEQADVADEFVRGLVDAFGVSAEVSVRIEGDAVLVDVEGDDLGLLVGPKGATLRSIEDLVRTIVQRSTDGHGARIHVDVGGYQAKRRAALANFATEIAGRVRESRSELALEPMPASDRKVVHDTIAELDGVTTTSEGEEPRRRVVILPA